MTTTLVKKLNKNNVLWGIRNKTTKHIVSVYEHRKVARETIGTLSNKIDFEVVRLEAAKEKYSKNKSTKNVSVVPKSTSAKLKQMSFVFENAEEQMTINFNK